MNESDFVDLLNKEMEELQKWCLGKEKPKTAVGCQELVKPFVCQIEKLKFDNYKKDQRIAELEEQLSRAIVPKFKMGDVLYYIFRDSVEFMKVYAISQFREKEKDIFYGNGLSSYWNENELFVNEEEAKAKLEELKNGE